MAGLIIRDIPEALHTRLKQQATAHHRSMNKEVIALLEQALNMDTAVREIPPPYQGRQRLTDAFINKAKREGRK
jgi:hypothetical protein